MVKADIDKLSYLSENDMMYIMLQGTVYGIDLKSNESLVVAQGLTEEAMLSAAMPAGLHGRKARTSMNPKRSMLWILILPRNRKSRGGK